MASAAEVRAAVTAANEESNGAILSTSATHGFITTMGVDLNVARRAADDTIAGLLEIAKQVKEALARLRSVSDGSANPHLNTAISWLEKVERETEDDIAKTRSIKQALDEQASKISELTTNNDEAMTHLRGSVTEANAYASGL